MDGWWNWWRMALMVGGLLLAGVVLTSTGVLTKVAPWLAPPASWRADRIEEASASRDDENLRLREQLIRLNAENAELRRRLRDYAAIAGEGGFDAVLPVLRRVRVLSRSSRQSERYLTVDGGTYDGVEVGNAVLAGWTLVGVLAGEEPGRGLVRLVTDSDSRIPAHLVADIAAQDAQTAMTQDAAATLTTAGPDAEGQGGESGVEADSESPESKSAEESIRAASMPVALALGVAVGTGQRDELHLEMVEDRPGLTVRPGMAVVTAGGPGTIAPGLVIGEVVEAELPPDSDHWRIVVRPLRRGDLESSLVVLRAPAPALEDAIP